MKEIRLTYLDFDIRLPTYCMVFFRMIGVYVHERVICTNQEEEITYPELNVDIDIFILQDATDGILYWMYDNNNVNLYVIPADSGDEYGKQGIRYSDSDSNQKILKELIKKIAKTDRDFAKDQKYLLMLADIYSKNMIMETVLGTRFFIPDQYNYRTLCPYYDRAIEQIYEEDISDSSIFTGFIVAYLAYELNFYGKRLNKVFFYDTDSILELLFELKEKEGYWCSLELLIAQIYGDLLEDYDQAMYHYSLVKQHRNNSFVSYKLGDLYKNQNLDLRMALRRFGDAVEINPMYYRAIYQVGSCQLAMGKVVLAKKSFERMIEILEVKSRKNLLRPIEAEYLYKTYLRMGRVEYEKYGDIYYAVHRYRQAEELWERIKNQKGSAMINAARCNRKLLEDQFIHWVSACNISYVYEQLHMLYTSIGDEEGVQEYELKMNIS